MLFIPIRQPLLLPAATGEKGAYILFRAKRDYVHKLSDTGYVLREDLFQKSSVTILYRPCQDAVFRMKDLPAPQFPERGGGMQSGTF